MFNLCCWLTHFVGVVLLYSISMCLLHGVGGQQIHEVTRNMADRRMDYKIFFLRSFTTKYRFVWNGTLGCSDARKLGCSFSLWARGGGRTCVVTERYDVTDKTFNLVFNNQSTPRQSKVFTHLDTVINVNACGEENAMLNVKMKTDYIRNNNSTVILVAVLLGNHRPDHNTIASSTPDYDATAVLNPSEEGGEYSGIVLVVILLGIVFTIALCTILIYCIRRVNKRSEEAEQNADQNRQTVTYQMRNAHQGQVLSPPPTENPQPIQNVLPSAPPFPEEHPGFIQGQTPVVPVFPGPPPSYDEVMRCETKMS